MNAARPLALLVAVAFAVPVWGQMYKCIDANGVTHYTDTPVTGCKGSEVDIRPLPSVSGGEAKPRGPDFAQQEAEFKRRQNLRATVEAQERAALEARCASLHDEAARLSDGRPLVRFNEQGERAYVPDEVRRQRLARVREALRACP